MLTDQQLLEIANKAYEKRRAVRNFNLGIQAIRDGMADLDDAQRTRAIALKTFDIDSKLKFPQAGTPSITSWPTNVMRHDPTLIKDPTGLKQMIAAETDVRKFYILAAMTVQLQINQGADFVAEMAPMLFRQEEVANIIISDYHETTAGWKACEKAYGFIINNLARLKADFVPPDKKLPYEQRIPILVDWLRANWPGCEKLGLEQAAAAPAVEPDPAPAPDVGETSGSTAAVPASWLIAGVALALLLAATVWIRAKALKR